MSLSSPMSPTTPVVTASPVASGIVRAPELAPLIVPVLGRRGHDQRLFRNTFIQQLAHQRGLTATPMVIREIVRPTEAESYAEYRHDLLRQLQPIVHGGATYLPLYPVGSTRSSVVFVHEALEPALLSLVKCAEEVVAYMKAACTTEYCYGLHSLRGVHLELVPDERDGILSDGLGYASPDILQGLGAENIIQFRAFHHGLRRPGLAKGLLKPDATLPARTIRFSHSQLKGRIVEADWQGVHDLDIGVLRRFQGRPSYADESWSFLEFWPELRNAEVGLAVEEVRRLVACLRDPVRLCELRGILQRDPDALSTVDALAKIMAGATNSRLPCLLRHPHALRALTETLAGRLRHLAVSGSREYPFPVVTEVLTTQADAHAIHTTLYPIGTELAVARYPILEGRNIAYGVVTGESDSDAEVVLGREIAKVTASDSDGDCVMLIAEPARVALARRLAEERKDSIKKNHTRLCSSLYELPDVIMKNLFSAGVGSATLAMIAFDSVGDEAGRHRMAELTQACTDSMKYSVDTREGRREAKAVLEEIGLPAHLCHRDDRRQFRDPATTDAFDSSPLWHAVATTYKEEMAGVLAEALPLRAFAGVLGHEAFQLDAASLRELAGVYRFWCARVQAIMGDAELDDEERRGRFRSLTETLLAWKAGLREPRQWAAAAWVMVHSGAEREGERAGTGAFAIRVFEEELLPMLAEAYGARELIPLLYRGRTQAPAGVVARWRPAGLELVPAAMASGVDTGIGMGASSTITEVRSGGRRDYGVSEEPVQVSSWSVAGRQKAPASGTTAPALESIALVALADGVTPERVADLVRAGGLELRSTGMALPALGVDAQAVYETATGAKLAEVAHADTAKALRLGGLRGGEQVVFRRSVKLFFGGVSNRRAAV